MKSSRLCLAIAAAALMGLLTPAAAHADTYQILNLTSGDRTGIIGITASGTVVLVYNTPVGAEPCKSTGVCQTYETWVNGDLVNSSTTAPDFVYDNGAPCTVSPAFLSSSVPGTCNNGHEVYNAGPFAAIPYIDETFTGPDPVADLFAEDHTFIEDVNLNASGDFVFNESHPTGGAGQYAEAIDLTTDLVPEPASIFLLGTGLLGMLGTLRRRPFLDKRHA